MLTIAISRSLRLPCLLPSMLRSQCKRLDSPISQETPSSSMPISRTVQRKSESIHSQELPRFSRNRRRRRQYFSVSTSPRSPIMIGVNIRKSRSSRCIFLILPRCSSSRIGGGSVCSCFHLPYSRDFCFLSISFLIFNPSLYSSFSLRYFFSSSEIFAAYSNIFFST